MRFVERDILPFSPEPLRGEKLLVLAPHPDDEVIGCGGLVALHAREGRRIHIIVATDGGEAERGDVPRERFVSTREEESNAGLRELGAPPAEFLRIPDRFLEQDRDRLLEVLKQRILELGPDLVVLPSPIEIHPDHAALAHAFVTLVQSDAEIAAALAVTRIAFMEISQPILPNAIVDVSEVAEAKERAIRRHASQQGVRDYARIAIGLNRYRTMTLPPGTALAEAFWITNASWLRSHPLSELASTLRGPRIEAEAAPIEDVTVIVRTHDRPRLLEQAIASIRAGAPAVPIVIVNDGPGAVSDALERTAGVTVVATHDPRGRSHAMNRGVEAATTGWIAFLDDDDLYYPEHLPVLVRAAGTRDARGWYSDAVSVLYETGGDGEPVARERQRTYTWDFDPDVLALDNYIPLPTLLLRREDYLRAGGFDPEFDLFEDWDFILRLARLGPLTRVPRLTCEIRHFAGSESAILRNPSGSGGYRDAKLKVWRKHGLLDDAERIVRGVEGMKARLHAAANRFGEEVGRGRHLERDIVRLEREKQTLISSLGESHARAEGLDAHVAELNEEIARRDETIADLHADRGRLDARVQELEDALRRNAATTGDLYGEIERLNALINQIHGTRAWRLHQTVERIRGRK